MRYDMDEDGQFKYNSNNFYLINIYIFFHFFSLLSFLYTWDIIAKENGRGYRSNILKLFKPLILMSP